MKRNPFLSALAMLAVGIMLFACKGEVGPKGDTGATGATGANGTAGVKGDKGDIGNANVVQFKIGAGVYQSAGEFFEIPLTGMTFEKAQASAILVYLEVGTGTTYLLPGVVQRGSDLLAEEFVVRLVRGTTTPIVEVLRAKGTGAFNFASIRVIVIPSTAAARTDGTNPVNHNDYAAVKKYYNLAD